MRKSLILAIAIVLLCAVLTGCTSYFFSGVETGYSGSQYGTVMNGHFGSFNGEKGARFSLKQGDRISISYSLSCESGTLTLTFEDKSGAVLFQNSDPSGTEDITADADQAYTLRITADSAKTGSYDITWSVTKPENT